ncbi:MAG TPA: hypothetical protein VGN23_08565 [Verrucomicrobiae bacterium]|jgi:hypothetical protein
MSLINEALKRAHESQGKEPAAATPLPPMAPMTPVPASPPSGGFGWFLPAAVVVLLVAAGIFIGMAFGHKSSKPAARVIAKAALVAPSHTPTAPAPVATPAPIAASPAPAPASLETSPAPANNSSTSSGFLTEHRPKVQGIIFTQLPTAIVNGKVVYAGDHVGRLLVKQITRNKVVFQSDDGSVKELGVGE